MFSQIPAAGITPPAAEFLTTPVVNACILVAGSALTAAMGTWLYFTPLAAWCQRRRASCRTIWCRYVTNRCRGCSRPDAAPYCPTCHDALDRS